jgi:hypothetical protein
METIVLRSIPVSISTADAARYVHVKPDTEDYQELDALVKEAVSVARPKAAYTTSFVTNRGEDFVELDGVRMNSRIMPQNLSKVHRVFPYVATCGEEVDRWSAGISDMLHSYWMDGVKEMILGQASEYLDRHFTDTLQLGKYSSMNPGSLPDWPVTAQTSLFSLLGDVKELIGVTLTDSMLMLPTKSMSGLAFQTESGYKNCRLCARKNCQGRQAPFDEAMYTELIGEAKK